MEREELKKIVSTFVNRKEIHKALAYLKLNTKMNEEERMDFVQEIRGIKKQPTTQFPTPKVETVKVETVKVDPLKIENKQEVEAQKVDPPKIENNQELETQKVNPPIDTNINEENNQDEN